MIHTMKQRNGPVRCHSPPAPHSGVARRRPLCGSLTRGPLVVAGLRRSRGAPRQGGSALPAAFRCSHQKRNTQLQLPAFSRGALVEPGACALEYASHFCLETASYFSPRQNTPLAHVCLETAPYFSSLACSAEKSRQQHARATFLVSIAGRPTVIDVPRLGDSEGYNLTLSYADASCVVNCVINASTTTGVLR